MSPDLALGVLLALSALGALVTWAHRRISEAERRSAAFRKEVRIRLDALERRAGARFGPYPVDDAETRRRGPPED